MRKAIVPDAHLFEASLRDVKPLKTKRRVRATPKPAPVLAPAVEKPVSAPVRAPRGLPPAPKLVPTPKPQAPGLAPGLDSSTERKLARGLLPIDASIDLHGMTQAQAHATLDRFIARHVGLASRVLLVVTGKGKGGDGVLKRQMPEWVMAGPHASRILRIVSAARGHGGGGAFYVLLRRKR